MVVYDVAIIGLGPAGMTAGLFASRRGLKTVIIGEVPGGQMALAHVVENYPGVERISGKELTEIMKKQCEKFGCEIVVSRVTDLELKGEVKKVKTDTGEFLAKCVILATGGRHRKLNVEGEDKFLGKGVSYCASCDGPFFKGKKVMVIGGSDSAVTTALYLKSIGCDVTLVHRRDSLRAEEANQKKLFESDINILWDSVVERINGDEKVESVVIKNVKTGETREFETAGIFIEIGMVPTVELAKKSGVETDERNFIKVNRKLETNVKGVYAAGEITGCIPQIVVAAGEGAVAATNAYFYLKGVYGKKTDWGTI
ncbi:MAG: thioredoxin-disulfide reductase [Candidatus Micrarchaeota archaeon]|nr:thioredoxin-disulfide reductase [Candidatus Micrarchaeota archaeon]